MTEEKNIDYLWKAAGSLTPLNHTKKLLKSYYLTISRKIARYKFVLPKDKFADVEMCEKCSTSWFDGNFSMKLISAKIRSSKAKRLVDNLESGKNLTKKEKNRAKWYRKKIFSLLQFKCKLCQNKTSVQLLKPSKDDDKSNIVPMDEIIAVKKSKKKKKEKFAGLKIEQISQRTEKLKLKTENDSKSLKSATDSQSSSTLKPTKTHKIIPKIQPNFVNTVQVKSLKKTKNKKVKVSEKSVISKTQQKNTILQLAQMLKQSASCASNESNKSENRLKNLLR